MDPIATGVVASVAAAGKKASDGVVSDAGGLLLRLLGPSADVIAHDWADRLRQRNLARLLKKTERLARPDGFSGWVQPRVAAEVFRGAEYANDEIITDYLSGVLASARAPEGGNDDAVPWAKLVERLSALQLRIHYVAYLNFRQVLRAADGTERIFEFDHNRITLPLNDFLLAVGLEPDDSGHRRFADAVYGLAKEKLIDGFALGDRGFFERDRARNRLELSFAPKTYHRLETPYQDVLMMGQTAFGVQLFLWGLGRGTADDATYLNPECDLQIDNPDPALVGTPLVGVEFEDSYWVEYDMAGTRVVRDGDDS